MREFSPNSFPTIGIEQEFHLIDPVTGDMKGRVDEVFALLDEDLRKLVSYELYAAVLENQSSVCRTVDELGENVARTRRRLGQACEKAGVKLASAASHPFANWRDIPIVDDGHYEWVVDQCQYIAHRLLSFGLHVHVGMASVEAAMYSMNEMRRWLYPLLALSANSPYYEGHATGLASTRAHLFGSMPRSHMPPYFETFGDLEAHYDKLLASGYVSAPGDLWWMIRPQPPFGTVEIRALDLPTDVRRLCALTAVCQGAMAHYQDEFAAGSPVTVLNDAYMQENRFKAMRYGLDCDIIEPAGGDIVSMKEYLGRLFELVEAKCEQLGSTEHLAFARRMVDEGTEAQWQVQRCGELGGDLRALELEIAERTLGGKP